MPKRGRAKAGLIRGWRGFGRMGCPDFRQGRAKRKAHRGCSASGRAASWLPALLVLLLGAGMTGCGGDPGTGPAEVKWDRIACDRCRMVLSDRKHAAQVRTQEPAGRSKVFFFDDIGCAIVWLQDKPAAGGLGTEIWVTDWRTGDWIDARTATYVRGQVTPMQYGLGAQSDPLPGGLTFERATAHVLDVEQRFNVHGVHLEAQRALRSGS